ncbi:ATP-dependent protease [Pseudomonas luteola]|uniref:LON peptidase substrate-binding domain-containing protein n=1 Tax=Pseudomonas luteola TaxID=47886 RepID=A0ABS0MR76_PSELU|nr:MULTISPECIES: LON peptidase substrate-binding domain-containing protein [Pseudomonas]MBH3439136.1 LON peptidase substrate-binding domain-containing protein [Pseudomonas luteola]MDN3234120.1 LON peptidase substrate-binding domain-containing protein [Pseudomonas sp. WAC2]RRW47874.1 ATP-dependent protease [Pseudomonas luteola]
MKLPLFPLSTTLFPGCPLDLQLFEPRYLDMISRCLKQNIGFGVVTILEGEEVGAAPTRLGGFGCEAVVRDWQQQSNGLLGVRVEGVRRFRLLDTEVQDDQLTMGTVEWLDEPAERPLSDQHDDLAALLQALAEHPMVAALDLDGTANGQRELGYQLGYLLPFTPDQKNELLSLDDPGERLDRLHELLSSLQE